jgi:calcineurin B family protein 1
MEDNTKNKDVNRLEPQTALCFQVHFALYSMIWEKMRRFPHDELLKVLGMMVGVNISDGQMGSIADRIIQEADQEGVRAISFTESIKVLEKEDVQQKMSIQFFHQRTETKLILLFSI